MNDIIECNIRIRKNPYDLEAFFMRGVAFYEMDEYEKALEDFNEVFYINPLNEAIYYYLGAISEKKNSNNLLKNN